MTVVITIDFTAEAEAELIAAGVKPTNFFSPDVLPMIGDEITFLGIERSFLVTSRRIEYMPDEIINIYLFLS